MRSLERGAEPDLAGRRLGDATDLPVVLRLIPQIGKVVEHNLRMRAMKIRTRAVTGRDSDELGSRLIMSRSGQHQVVR
jgi:hypothetical protein